MELNNRLGRLFQLGIKFKSEIFLVLALVTFMLSKSPVVVIDLTTVGIIFGSIALWLRIFDGLNNWELIDRSLGGFVPIMIVFTAAILVIKGLHTPFWDWNAARLAPTIALVRGYGLYYGSEAGPVSGFIYGPLGALVFLPAAIAESPTTAILIAAGIATGLFFLPILWLLIGESWGKPQNLIANLGIFLCFCFFCLDSPPLLYSSFSIHVDSPALGFGAIACGFLYFRQQKECVKPLIWSAIFAVMAVWTKQSILPILIALPVYILITDGKRYFNRYVVCLAIAFIGFTAFFTLIFGYENLFFNLIAIPKNHPAWWWVPKDLVGATKMVYSLWRDLIRTCFPSLIVILACSYFLMTKDFPGIRKWLDQNRWTLFVIVGVFLAPAAIAGRIKIGGDINAFSFTTYFIMAGAAMAVSKCINQPENIEQAENRKDESLAFVSKLIINALLLLFLLVQIPTFYFSEQLNGLATNAQQVAYEYAKKYPGETYFPWNPLTTVMAENKLFHFSNGLDDRELGGYALTDKHFRSAIPEQVKRVALGFNPQNDYVMKYLKEFNRKVEVSELPGWTVFEKQ
jgi:hypothetical protein